VQWLNRSFLIKMIIISLLLVMIPLIIVILFTFGNFQNYIEERTENSAQQIVNQLVMNLESQFQELNRLTIYPLYDDNILNILTSHKNQDVADYITSTEEHTVANFFSSIQYDRSEIKNALLFSLDGRILSNQIMGIAKTWDNSNRSWMSVADKDSTNCIVIPPNKCTYYTDDDKTPYLSVVRQLRLPLKLDQIGYIKIDLYPETLNRILSQIHFTPNSKLYILNQYDEMIYPMDTISIPEPINGETKVDGERYIGKISYCDNIGLKIYALISENDLQHDTIKIMSTLTTVSIITLFIAIILTIVSSKLLTKPIIELRNKMILVGQGQLDTRVSVRSEDEIGQLQLMFNEMVSRLDHLINEVYRVTISEKEAELSALQSQINPHFLYNTLEAINMMAILKSNNDISEAVSKLGALLRYCVDNEQRYMPLGEELTHTQTYIKIQQLRNKAVEPLNIQMPQKAIKFYIPKLILQPFIENIIEHADYNDRLLIKIDIQIFENTMVIGIYDNGRPIDKRTKAKIKRLLAKGNNDNDFIKKKSYGLTNVQKRIKLLFGEEYGVTLDETYDAGVGFTLRLKLLQKVEKEEEEIVQNNDR